jgi:hypothetical protein
MPNPTTASRSGTGKGSAMTSMEVSRCSEPIWLKGDPLAALANSRADILRALTWDSQKC